MLAAVNIRGVSLGSGVIRGLAGLKLGVLGFLVLWGLCLGRGDWSNFVPLVEQRPGSAPLATALIGGMIAAFFSLGGWWDVSKLAGEVRDPGRILPRAMLLGVGLVTLVYILISVVFLYLVPPERIDSRETFAALAGEVLFGRAGGVVLSLIVIITVLGSLAALLMAMPRVYFAMARDGLFFPAAAVLHSRYHTPARAIVIQAGLASLLSVLGTFDEILAYFIVPTVLFVGLTVAAVFVLNRGPQNTQRVLSVPWHPIPPLLFLVPTAVLLVLLAMNQPKHAGIGLAVVMLGLPAYHLVFARLATRQASESASSLDESSPASTAMKTT
jgi:APA family basic amino acid/polyamine antiporter